MPCTPYSVQPLRIDLCKTQVSRTVDARYFLSLTFTEDPKRIAYVMMNPSKADENCSDGTINNVINFTMKQIDQENFMIRDNMFPFYEPKSKKLADLVKRLKAELTATNFKKSSHSINNT